MLVTRFAKRVIDSTLVGAGSMPCEPRLPMLPPEIRIDGHPADVTSGAQN